MKKLSLLLIIAIIFSSTIYALANHDTVTPTTVIIGSDVNSKENTTSTNVTVSNITSSTYLKIGTGTSSAFAITSLAGQTGCASFTATGVITTSTCSGGAGLTSLNGQTGATQTFATGTDANIQLRITSAGDIHTFTPVWASTLADSRITSAATWNAKITTSSLSSTATGLSYDNNTGIFSWTAGYEGLRTASSTNWNTAYDDRLKWDGGATGLVAATGRTSLGLTDTATIASSTWLKVALNGSDINSTSTFRSNLGLTDTVLYASSTWLKVLNNLSDLNDAATARTNLGVAIGTNVQAWDNDLDDFAALTPTKGDLITTAGTDWVDLVVGTNGKVLTASSTATNGISWETIIASASAGGADTNVQVNEGGTIAGYSTLTYASGTQLLTTPSSTITGFLKIPNGAGGTTVNAAGHITNDTTSRTLNFYDGTAEVVLNPEQCHGGFVIENPTSTVGTIDNNPGTMIMAFNTTSTITKVKAVNTRAADTFAFNLTYNTNRNSATSTFAVFSAQQTITSTSTLTELTSFASSSPNKDDILRISFTSASSSQAMVDVCWRQVP